MLQLIAGLRTNVSSLQRRLFLQNRAERPEGAVKLRGAATGKPTSSFFRAASTVAPPRTIGLDYLQDHLPGRFPAAAFGVFVAPYPYAYKLGMSDTQTADYFSGLRRTPALANLSG